MKCYNYKIQIKLYQYLVEKKRYKRANTVDIINNVTQEMSTSKEIKTG